MIHGIFAAEYRGGIGFNGTLPWPRNHEDMKYFQEITAGHVVIMGRKTWDDPKMPNPLPNRINYVVTNRPIGNANVRTIKGDIIQKIKEIQEIHHDKNVFVIGGKEIIEKASILFDNLYVTHIKGNYRHDTKIQLDKFLLGFQARSARPSADGSCTFMVYRNLFRV